MLLHTIAQILLNDPWQFSGILFIIGACIGSFINVVVYRLPIILENKWRNESILCLDGTIPNNTEPFNLACPSSRCPKCSHKIPFWANVPILGYFFVKGHCIYCKNKIALRYPLVEFVTALLFATTVDIAIKNGFVALLAAMVFIGFVLSMILIDYDTMLLPDELTLPFLWLGLVVNIFYPLASSLKSAVIGAILGYLMLWLFYQAFKLITKKEGMGFGDFKFLAGLGAWFGFEYIGYIVLIAAMTSIIYTIGLKLCGKFTDISQPIPFGPFLGIAGFVCLFAPLTQIMG